MEIFPGLGHVVFVPLIGGFYVKSLVCSFFLHIIYFLDSLKNDNKDNQEKNNDENGNRVACDDSNWVVDSGANFHVTSRMDFFSSYTPGDFGVLKT